MPRGSASDIQARIVVTGQNRFGRTARSVEKDMRKVRMSTAQANNQILRQGVSLAKLTGAYFLARSALNKLASAFNRSDLFAKLGRDLQVSSKEAAIMATALEQVGIQYSRAAKLLRKIERDFQSFKVGGITITGGSPAILDVLNKSRTGTEFFRGLVENRDRIGRDQIENVLRIFAGRGSSRVATAIFTDELDEALVRTRLLFERLNLRLDLSQGYVEALNDSFIRASTALSQVFVDAVTAGLFGEKGAKSLNAIKDGLDDLIVKFSRFASPVIKYLTQIAKWAVEAPKEVASRAISLYILGRFATYILRAALVGITSTVFPFILKAFARLISVGKPTGRLPAVVRGGFSRQRGQTIVKEAQTRADLRAHPLLEPRAIHNVPKDKVDDFLRDRGNLLVKIQESLARSTELADKAIQGFGRGLWNISKAAYLTAAAISPERFILPVFDFIHSMFNKITDYFVNKFQEWFIKTFPTPAQRAAYYGVPQRFTEKLGRINVGVIGGGAGQLAERLIQEDAERHKKMRDFRQGVELAEENFRQLGARVKTTLQSIGNSISNLIWDLGKDLKQMANDFDKVKEVVKRVLWDIAKSIYDATIGKSLQDFIVRRGGEFISGIVAGRIGESGLDVSNVNYHALYGGLASPRGLSGSIGNPPPLSLALDTGSGTPSSPGVLASPQSGLTINQQIYGAYSPEAEIRIGQAAQQGVMKSLEMQLNRKTGITRNLRR